MGRSTCRVKGRRKLPRLLEAGYHLDVRHTNYQPRCGILPTHDARKGSCKGGEVKDGLVPPGLPGVYTDFYSYGLLYGRNTWSGGLSHTEYFSRTTQLQSEEVILRNVWLCAGKDVTNNSEFQQPAPLRPSRQRGAYLATT